MLIIRMMTALEQEGYTKLDETNCRLKVILESPSYEGPF